ncbi:hypothetical protein PHYSODRAFT_329463 [Phytophthora sojae]|uniref:Uncharacterized protein n=1 Tax=Phytophthora sojae (strain P6497) TaxID=1094619 RepID=G4Z3X8_PHYSP|nr:hypothetical protein PHYSODRAFT_329463 [Phytophthora sojae]EGZ21530.1 hypothetical protein PHYSODRAFT_329463 [Phytophthora sojae]|eukprot:XP_009524247.1 hypothetical protein PHYSODRAFT_329463 [Phytophthora sojae]
MGTTAKSLDDILAALDVLALLVEEVYQPFVGENISLHYREEELADLVFWIDERLEKSFIQVQNIIHERRLGSLQASAATTSLPPRSWGSYRFADQWRDVVRQGVVPRWKDGFPWQDTPPPNHGSARRALNALIKNIRKGPDEDRYLVLDIDLLGHLDGIFCSPFGAVPKGDKPLSEDARVIHDLSFPVHGSVNEFTVPETEIAVHYDGARAIAARIEEVETHCPGLARRMSGDVSGAFRHIPLHDDHCGHFSGTIPELGVLIVDLCCPFGWRNSPAAYAIAGGAINHLYSTSKPLWPLQPAHGTREFDGKVWCDDHNCVEPAVGTRLEEAATELRAAMVAVLGPSACNEDKFTAWVTRGSALGLDWDLQRRTVSMPQAKIEKARQRVCDLQHPAPFFQRLADAQRRTPHVGCFPLAESALDDLRWFRAILSASHFNSIPLARFTRSQPPSVEVLMDASDVGLCALLLARREYIQVRLDAEERAAIHEQKHGGAFTFGINIRELMSAAFAAITWGHLWTASDDGADVHVRLRIDNTSAVAWSNKRAARDNPYAQMLLRLIALLEVRHGFCLSAEHIPGSENVMADAGSRSWESRAKAAAFTKLCVGWSQVTVPPSSRKLSQVWARCSAREL